MTPADLTRIKAVTCGDISCDECNKQRELLVKAVEDKDKALARVLKYLRTPDAEDAEYIERLIENALNPKAKR